jgi:putative flippase GtrA
MNKNQIFGNILLAVVLIVYYLNTDYLPDYILGIIAAISVGFIFKLIPFKKRTPEK